MASTSLTVVIPSQRLLEKARRFRNEDFLATYTRKVQCDSVTNYTTAQIMRVVEGLNDTLTRIAGMEKVGQEIANTMKPLIMTPMTFTSAKEQDCLSALFAITPTEIKLITVSDEEMRDSMDESVRQTATKFKKESALNNGKTMFYMCKVLAAYYPKSRTFDFHYAYVYCRDTSIWQWARSGNDKKKRMTALELEGMQLLGTTLATHSNNTVAAIEKDEPEFNEMEAVLNTAQRWITWN